MTVNDILNKSCVFNDKDKELIKKEKNTSRAPSISSSISVLSSVGVRTFLNCSRDNLLNSFLNN